MISTSHFPVEPFLGSPLLQGDSDVTFSLYMPFVNLKKSLLRQLCICHGRLGIAVLYCVCEELCENMGQNKTLHRL